MGKLYEQRERRGKNGMALHNNMIKGYLKFPLRKFLLRYKIRILNIWENYMNKGKERVKNGMALHDNMIKGYPKFPLRKFYTSFLSKVTKNQEIKQGKIRENIT